MPKVEASSSLLLLVDFQTRLMTAIDQGPAVIENARRLALAARKLGVPVVFTEQNAKGLGPTAPELVLDAATVVAKMTFDATRARGFPTRHCHGRSIIVTGCEAHVCVLQTVLSLLEQGHKVLVARDAIGSRRAENKEAALLRLDRHGAEIVTTEMMLFEWLGSAEHPHFREIIGLIK
jgi:nicotinamidase-related amidase